MGNAAVEPEISEPTRSDIERALWELTAFQQDSVAIDAVLVAIDAYAAVRAERLAKAARAERDDIYHTLVTLAAELLDTGSRMRLVPARPIVPSIVATPAPTVRKTNVDPSLPAGQLRCKGCGAVKDEELFAVDRSAATGRKGKCKACEKAHRDSKKKPVAA